MTSQEYLESKRSLLRKGVEEEWKFIQTYESTPERKSAIIELAEEAMRGMYFLPGVEDRLAFVGNPPKWKELPVKNEEFLWALARFPGVDSLTKAYILTGDKKYAEKALSDTVNFIDTCPKFALENLDDPTYLSNSFGAGTVNPWRQLEVGLRSATSLRFLYHRLILDDAMTPEIHDKLAMTFHDHAAQLSVVSPILWPDGAHNHFLSEMTGLLSIVALFPEFDESEAWTKQALAGLERCATAQIMTDGAQIEGSPHYHDICIETFISAMEMAATGNIKFSDTFYDLFNKSLTYAAWFYSPFGVISSIGDSGMGPDIINTFISRLGLMGMDVGDLYLISNLIKPPATFNSDDYRRSLSCSFTSIGSPVLIDSKKLNEMKARADKADGGIRHFKSVGQIFARTGWGKNDSWFSMICHTPIFNGHAHCDPLSVELVLGGRPIIVDPSYGTYEEGEIRKTFKSAAYHSCLTFGEREPFDYIRQWEYTPQKFGTTENIYEEDGFLAGDGYHTNYEPNEHHRLALLDGDTFCVVDKVKNVTGEDVVLHFHMYDDSFDETDEGYRNSNVRVILPAGTTKAKVKAKRSSLTDIYDDSMRLSATDSSHKVDALYISVFTTNPTLTDAKVEQTKDGIVVSYNKDGKARSFTWRG